MQHPLAILVGVAGGLLSALMMRLNATLGERIGVLESSVVVHTVGTLFAMCLLGRVAVGAFVRRVYSAPRRLWGAGLIGLVIVTCGNWVIPPLGLALVSAVVITATLGFSLLADHAGWFNAARFPVTPRRLIGVGCAVLGTVLIALRLV